MNQKKMQKKWPYISVIVPLRNNHSEVLQLEKSLRGQSYPPDRVEFIFIDNGSELSFEFPESFKKSHKLLTEDTYLNSPYSARNRGIERAVGEIIAFIDANSQPDENWLKEGVNCLVKSESDLSGGNIEFDFQNRITAGKIVDALTSLNMQKAIEERGAAYTANLFVKKELFEKLGMFEEGVRSGGDVRWALMAREHGCNISFCGSSTVKKFARSAGELYRKRIRTGKGYYYTWKKEPAEKNRPWFYNFFRSLKPPRFSTIRQANARRYRKEFDKKMVLIWFHFYVAGIVEQGAFIWELFRNRLR